MKKIFDYAQDYIEKMNVKDITLLKFCMFAVGVLVGIHVTEKSKKKVLIAAACVFTFTYIPLMSKFLGGICTKKNVCK